MNLSKSTIEVLVDLIENKLSVMQIGDREELCEVATLERSLKELQALAKDAKEDPTAIKHCGRRKKFASLIEEYRDSAVVRARTA